MSSSKTPETKNEKIKYYLAEIRKKLLDLTSRNKLLNYSIDSKTSIQIVNKSPDKLYEMFLSEKSIQFVPISNPTEKELIEFGYIEKDSDNKEIKLKPYPSAKEWAKVIGINTNYELPSVSVENIEQIKDSTTSHQNTIKNSSTELKSQKNNVNFLNNGIQVLLYPNELEATLKKIYNNSQTAIEESGAGILYFSIGFLSWIDIDQSRSKRLAPLFIIPVKLERGKLDAKDGLYKYHLYYTGEDILPNISLKEKLKNDFGLALPDFNEEIQPENYIKQIIDIVKKIKPEWEVKRYANLGLLNFTKMTMYLDLDPQRWPQNENNILCHDIIKRFFISQEVGEESSDYQALNEYLIDSYPEIHKIAPLIYDADSSQHSALIDVQQGKNLVIEGPPGSGKSQTISNIIAASLLQGKKILFVAEKMAALNVVKERLDKAGLGDFCLELHSHKTNKREVLENLSERLNIKNDFCSEKNIALQISKFENFKNKLNDYAEQINKQWAKTGFTIHQIFCKATQYRDQISIEPAKLYVDKINSNEFNQMNFWELMDKISIFKKVYSELLIQIGDELNINDHPWSGVYNTNIQKFDLSGVLNLLINWQKELSESSKQIISFVEKWKILNSNQLTKGVIDKLATIINNLPTLKDNRIFALLPALDSKESIIAISDYISSFKDVQLNYNKLSSSITFDHLYNIEKNISPELSIEQLKKWDLNPSTTINNLIDLFNRIKANYSSIKEKYSQLKDLKQILQSDVSTFMSSDKKGFDFIANFLGNITFLPPALLHLRNEYFDNDEADSELDTLNIYITEIRDLKNELKNIFKLNNLLSYNELNDILDVLNKQHFFSWLSPQWRNAKKRLLAMSASSSHHFEKMKQALPQLLIYIEKLNKFESSNFKAKSLPIQINLDTDVTQLLLVREWYKKIRNHYGIGFGHQVVVGDTILNLDANVIKGVHAIAKNDIGKSISQTVQAILDDLNIAPNFLNQLNTQQWLDEEGILLPIIEKLEKDLISLQTLFTNSDITFGQITEYLSSIQFIIKTQLKYTTEINNELKPIYQHNLNFVYGYNKEKENEHTLKVLEETLLFANYLKEMEFVEFANCIRNIGSLDIYLQLCKHGNEIVNSWNIQLDNKNKFIDETLLDENQWFNTNDPSLNLMIARNQIAISKDKWLNGWIDFLKNKGTMESLGLLNIWQAVMNKTLPIEKIKDGLQAAIFEQLSKDIIKQQPELTLFSGKDLNAWQEVFAKYDKELLLLQRQQIANHMVQKDIPKGYAGGKKSEYTELSLIQNEVGKKTRHIPIRQLVKRSGNALQALKPCFMMSPMSAAHYLAPGEIVFDLVVMDEASQVKPEDALGVIARGKQFVVVGDPKQLPPTSFFDRYDTDNEDEDATALSQTDSILDAAIPLFSTRRLRWHYRSQHEHLIAFSNNHFYNNDLVIFPSPNPDYSEYGISFNYISNGIFTNQCNINEAKSIVESVINHAINNPKETIGIVAMNTKQRDQIEKELEEVRKKDSQIEKIIESCYAKESPLFIKNLENVQGDERDVIFISFTYGPDETGRVYQRFGPINSDTGWRRLNVLLTRSKKRMNIFSSMKAEDIVIKETSKKGVTALKAFLKFAETKQINNVTENTKRSHNNDFEISVIKYLEKAGFKCKSQVGVSEFYIDIAVIDPGNPGRYLMGIECDGASYHSAKSARDRDRLRHEILERLGWNIKRIWSIDWFSNPEEIIEPIIRKLNELKTESFTNKNIINND